MISLGRLRLRSHVWIRAGAALVAGVAALALFGWLTDVTVLASFGSGRIPMAPSTAVLLLFSAGLLFALIQIGNPPRPVLFRVVLLMLVLVAAPASLLLATSLRGIYSDVEHFCIIVQHIPGGAIMGHMSPLTAFCFLLFAASALAVLFSRRLGRSRWNFVVWLFAGLLVLVSVALILAYLYGTPFMYNSGFIPPALSTSIAFLALGAALCGLARLHPAAREHRPDDMQRSGVVLFVVFLVVAAAIVATGLMAFRKMEVRFRSEVEKNLSAITDLKVAELVRWRQERLADGAVYYQNPAFVGLVRRFLTNPSDTEIEIRGWMARSTTNSEYDRISLFSAAGAELLSVPAGTDAEADGQAEPIRAALQLGKVLLANLAKDALYDRPYMQLMVPLFDGQIGSSPLGVLVMRIDPYDYLYPLINSWPVPSRTAESLLVRREGDSVLFLNDLRFMQVAALDLKIPLSRMTLPAVQAVLGVEGMVTGLDYRNEPVVACVRAVPESPWYMVTRMDLAEVYAPLRSNLWALIGIVCSLLITAGAVVFAVWRRQHSRYYRDRLQLAEVLRRNMERQSVTLKSIGDAVISTDEQGRVELLNPVAEALTGWTQAQACGRPLEDVFRIFKEDTQEKVENPVTKVLREGGVVGLANHTILVARDGTVCPIADSGAPIRDETGSITGVVLVFRDQTAERASEKALHRIEWLLTRPFSPHAQPYTPPYGDLSELNTEGVIRRYVGKERLTGIVTDYLDLLETSGAVYEKNGDYALGMFSSGWCRFMDEASHRLCGTTDGPGALACGKWLCHESCWTKVSKETIESGVPVDRECEGGIHIYAEPVRAGDEIIGAINFGYGDPPRDAETLEVLAAKYQVDVDDLRRHAAAYESRPPFMIEMAKKRLAVSARMIGEIVERKRAEEQRLLTEDALRQAQKMESVGRLAGGVAHDFNNLLMGIMGYTELCREAIPPGNPVRGWLDEIMKEAERSAALTRQLLAFARKQTIAPKVLDLNDAVEGMLKMLRQLMGESIHLAWEPGNAVWPVKTDPGQLDQILVNLCVNARDAIGGVGKVTIETRNRIFDDAYCRHYEGCHAGDYAMLAVTDDGCGMDQETLKKIFEPFFTTKKIGEGTGLGLSTVYGIVRQSGGFVTAYSEPGKGSVFCIYLPRSKQAGEYKSVVPPPPVERVGGTETILLVEDESSVRVTASLLLKHLGYTVLEAESPLAALRLASEHAGGIDLLMTDVIMPGMSGRALAEKLSASAPSLKILFMSGYTANVIGDRGILEGNLAFLAKPFTSNELAGKVREVLDGA